MLDLTMGYIHLFFRKLHLLLLDDLESRIFDQLLHVIDLSRLHGIGLDHSVSTLSIEPTAATKPHWTEAHRRCYIRLQTEKRQRESHVAAYGIG